MILRLLTLISLFLPSTLADVSTRPFLGNWGITNLELDCYDPDRRCQLDFTFTQDTASDPISSESVWYYPKEQSWGHVVSERYYLQAAWARIPSNGNDIPGNNLSSLLVLVMFDTKLGAFATFNVYEKLLHDFGGNAADQYQAAHYLNPYDGPTAGATPTTADPTAAVEVVARAPAVTMGAMTMGAMRMDKHRARVKPRATAATAATAVSLPNALAHRDEGNNPIWQILQLHRLYKADEKAMYLSFTINSQSGPLAKCAMRIADTDGTSSWFGKGCDSFSISWGYNRDNDGAVMTVCNAKTGQDAFFGFDNVNNPGVVYTDSKWEPAGKSGCK